MSRWQKLRLRIKSEFERWKKGWLPSKSAAPASGESLSLCPADFRSLDVLKRLECIEPVDSDDKKVQAIRETIADAAREISSLRARVNAEEEIYGWCIYDLATRTLMRNVYTEQHYAMTELGLIPGRHVILPLKGAKE